MAGHRGEQVELLQRVHDGGIQVKALSEPTVTFFGAARNVTGSMYLVEAHGRSVLLDCGLMQGKRAEALNLNREFPFRPKDIDAGSVPSDQHHVGRLASP